MHSLQCVTADAAAATKSQQRMTTTEQTATLGTKKNNAPIKGSNRVEPQPQRTTPAGPFASRAASAIGFIGDMIDYCERNAPLTEKLTATEVGNTAAFLCSPMGSGITGATVYVDKGYHAMGLAVDREGAASPEE